MILLDQGRGPAGTPEQRRSRRIALSVLLGLAFVAVANVASSIWVGLLGGVVMAFSAEPLFRRLAPRIGHRRSLAAGITTMCGGLTMLSAAALFLWIVARELLVIVDLIQQKVAGATSLEGLVGARAVAAIDAFKIPHDVVMTRIRTGLGEASLDAARGAGTILATTTSALVAIVLSLFTMYYVLLEWRRLSNRVERLLPLDPRHTRALMRELRDVGRSSFLGAMGTAVVQGVLAGLGFALAGVHEPMIWGLLTMAASLIPVIGTALVWGGIAINELATGNAGAAAFVAIWGIVVVMLFSDYYVRPRLVGSSGQTHPLLLLVALIGGVHVFGLTGLIAGPVVVSLFVAVVQIYEQELEREQREPAETTANGVAHAPPPPARIEISPEP